MVWVCLRKQFILFKIIAHKIYINFIYCSMQMLNIFFCYYFISVNIPQWYVIHIFIITIVLFFTLLLMQFFLPGIIIKKMIAYTWNNCTRQIDRYLKSHTKFKCHCRNWRFNDWTFHCNSNSCNLLLFVLNAVEEIKIFYTHAWWIR